MQKWQILSNTEVLFHLLTTRNHHNHLNSLHLDHCTYIPKLRNMFAIYTTHIQPSLSFFLASDTYWIICSYLSGSLWLQFDVTHDASRKYIGVSRHRFWGIMDYIYNLSYGKCHLIAKKKLMVINGGNWSKADCKLCTETISRWGTTASSSNTTS